MTTNNSNNPNDDSDDLKKIDEDITKHRKYARRLIITVFSIFIFYFCIKTTVTISRDVDGNWILPNLSNLTAVDSGDWGTFGDFIGGILNPIFALFAFYWLTYSVRLQIKELKDTRTELKKAADAQVETTKHQENIARLEDENVKTQQEILTLQRTSLDKQIESARLQQRQIAIQNFESLFFQLLRTKDDALNDIVYIKNIPQTKTPKFVADGQNQSISESKVEILKSVDAIKEHIITFKSNPLENWIKYYENNMLDYTGSYFRICYQIVKLIDQNESLTASFSTDVDKFTVYSNEQKKYFDIFRATLTKHEMEAFFFNCLNEYGNKKFKKLIEKYGLFEPLPIDLYRSEKIIHRLTKYAYQYEPRIFEKNKLWNNYFKEINKVIPNIKESELISLIKLMLNLEILKSSSLSNIRRIETNNPMLIGSSYKFNIELKFVNLEEIISEDNFKKIEEAHDSYYSKLIKDIDKSQRIIESSESYIKDIIDKFTKDGESIDEKKVYLVDAMWDIKHSISGLKDTILEAKKSKIKFKNNLDTYLKNKVTIKNSDYTITVLTLVKYGIDYTEYCNYMNLTQTIDNPP